MAEPYVYQKPFVSIGGTDYVCMATRVALTPADQMGDASTFCYPGLQIPSGLVVWTFEVTIKNGYGAAEFWNAVSAIETTKVAFVVRPDTGTIGVTNPQADFNAYVPTIPFMDATPGGTHEFTLSMVTVGDPVFTTV